MDRCRTRAYNPPISSRADFRSLYMGESVDLHIGGMGSVFNPDNNDKENKR
jgi:hypothetical protein